MIKDENFIFKSQYDWNECCISFPISNYNSKNTYVQEGAMQLVVWLIGLFGV